jgi:cytochrome oxidase Cu insertion factor (SCO1/SenC/PrrC family)
VSPLPRSGRSSRLTAVVLALLVLGGTLLAACSSSSAPGTPSPSLGIVQDRAVPQIPLVNQHGTPTTLAAFRGKTVILVPMLSLCQETCPLTTANLLVMQQAINQAGLAHRVVIVEYSIDPGRDSPARLTAYAKLTGASWTFLTGTPASIDAMNKFFYVFAQKVPEDTPPEIDWWTHQPLTYDINHTDGYFVIDPSGHQRFATSASPDVASHHLSKPLGKMLDDQGQQDLNDPKINGQTWTVPQALAVVGWVAGQVIPSPTT